MHAHQLQSIKNCPYLNEFLSNWSETGLIGKLKSSCKRWHDWFKAGLDSSWDIFKQICCISATAKSWLLEMTIAIAQNWKLSAVPNCTSHYIRNALCQVWQFIFSYHLAVNKSIDQCSCIRSHIYLQTTFPQGTIYGELPISQWLHIQFEWKRSSRNVAMNMRGLHHYFTCFWSFMRIHQPI